ncbi:hypothetical protein SAMN02745751_01144 [Dethiosulfatibacter aminovorans DSM 17477]|uniref:Uncharacterized protein n=1 Tax=Dethiosulfatibacter aminovorans DSM 17477 TaxID=1121476 RepID=A0A1M6EBU9_9FIRM|nr:hypothetical protein [Dethiosulfatibacter aminovorans]SHI82952.1 hypothetical protein SAMN02745751_01144 [Dethiosulfatibacter aminovorans DSM 17477]
MAKIIIIPENTKTKSYKKIYKYALSHKPDHIFKVCVNSGVRQLNEVECSGFMFGNSDSWIMKALNKLTEKVNFVEDEVMFLSEEIYTNQLKVWFTNYSAPLAGMSKQEINRTINKTLMKTA